MWMWSHFLQRKVAGMEGEGDIAIKIGGYYMPNDKKIVTKTGQVWWTFLPWRFVHVAIVVY